MNKDTMISRCRQKFEKQSINNEEDKEIEKKTEDAR